MKNYQDMRAQKKLLQPEQIIFKMLKKYFKKYFKKPFKEKVLYYIITVGSENQNTSLKNNKNIYNNMDNSIRKKRVKLTNVQRNYNRLESK